jgi:hypothetical protein
MTGSNLGTTASERVYITNIAREIDLHGILGPEADDTGGL